MGTPHKHAEIIKAWADGAEIQQREIGTTFWKNCYPKETHTPPFASTITEYRIKPQTIKYRTYLWTEKSGHSGVRTVTWQQNVDNDYEYNRNFIKWLGDWQEVEV